MSLTPPFWVIVSLVPAATLIIGSAATYVAVKLTHRLFPNEMDRIHRETRQGIQATIDLHDATSRRIDELERKIGKIERSLRRRKIWDSTEAPAR